MGAHHEGHAVTGESGLRPVDYDVRQYRNYQRGRALTPQQRASWIDAYAARLPAGRRRGPRRPGSGLQFDTAEPDPSLTPRHPVTRKRFGTG